MRKFQPQKRLPKILGDLFRVKIRLKWAIIPFFRCSKILGEAGRQARNFTIDVSKILDLKSSSEQIFFRKLLLGAPDKYRFLVAKDSLDMTIVGFNVIEEITKQPVDCASAGVGESVVDALS